MQKRFNHNLQHNNILSRRLRNHHEISALHKFKAIGLLLFQIFEEFDFTCYMIYTMSSEAIIISRVWCNSNSLLFACFAFNILISCLYILFVRLKNNYCFGVQEEGVMLIMIMMAIKRKTLKQQKNLAHASLRRPRHVVGSLEEKTERSRGTFHIISALLILTCLQKIKSHFNKHQRIYPSTLQSSHIIF